ncbi:MAG: helix-turn-helix domain-containing protein [Eubacterium sp.]|jgi:DNA-binding XRE family transcriptional regulator|nr:helix-turn-helix domain-containing protein [Eubacterium sp.]
MIKYLGIITYGIQFIVMIIILILELNAIKEMRSEYFYTSRLNFFKRILHKYKKHGNPVSGFHQLAEKVPGHDIQQIELAIGKDSDEAIKNLSPYSQYYTATHRSFYEKLKKHTYIIYAEKRGFTFFLKHGFKKATKETYGEELAKQISVPDEWHSIIFKPKERKERKRINYAAKDILDPSITPMEKLGLQQRARLMTEFSELCEEKHIEQSELALLCGIKNETISEMKQGSWEPRLETFLKALAPLGKTLHIKDLE